MGDSARVAAIDCGTNSVRLLIADPPADRAAPLVDLTRQLRIVRLGQGVDRTGRLAPEAIERTRVALADYAETIAASHVDRVRMVATSATRDAANADEFEAMVLRTLGTAPEVVTGQEEAALSFAGAVRGLPASLPAPCLVVDIGGGSTEFVLGPPAGGADSGPAGAISVDIGCVRMTERFLLDDPPTSAQIAAAEAHIISTVDRAVAAVDGRSARTLVGLAGSVTTVAALALGLSEYDPERLNHAEVTHDKVAAVTAELLRLTRSQRLELPSMHPGRADVIGAGALILRVIMDRLGSDRVVASEHDILDGIAWSLIDG